MKANSPPCTRPTPTHCPLTHPHTYLDSGCATVRCLGGGGGFCVCVCVCVSACVCGWVSADVCVCVGGWVVVSMCSWVSGCVCLCVCACWCEVQEGCVCMCVCVCVCVCVYGLCVYLVWCSSHPHPPHTQRRTPTPITKKTVIHPPPTQRHTHPHAQTHTYPQ